jgi:hypothetical protein
MKVRGAFRCTLERLPFDRTCPRVHHALRVWRAEGGAGGVRGAGASRRAGAQLKQRRATCCAAPRCSGRSPRAAVAQEGHLRGREPFIRTNQIVTAWLWWWRGTGRPGTHEQGASVSSRARVGYSKASSMLDYAAL